MLCGDLCQRNWTGPTVVSWLVTVYSCSTLQIPIVQACSAMGELEGSRQRIYIILVKWSNEYQFIVHKCINTSYKVIILCSVTTPPQQQPPALYCNAAPTPIGHYPVATILLYCCLRRPGSQRNAAWLCSMPNLYHKFNFFLQFLHSKFPWNDHSESWQSHKLYWYLHIHEALHSGIIK